MGVMVKWIDPNIDPLDTVEIWRADSKNGAPVLLGSVDGTEREFEDETAGRNKVHWYTLKSVLGQSEINAKPFPIGNFPDTGPGPQDILRGSWEFGFFGEVPGTELPTFGAIRDVTGIVANPAANPVKFLKWVVNGKILYIPDVPYNTAVGDLTAVKKFMLPVDGTPDSGILLESQGYNFAIRPPFITTDYDTEVTTLGIGGDATLKVSETSALVSSILGVDSAYVYSPFKWGDLVNPGTSIYFVTNTYTNASGLVMLTSLTTTPVVEPMVSAAISRAVWVMYELLLD